MERSKAEPSEASNAGVGPIREANSVNRRSCPPSNALRSAAAEETVLDQGVNEGNLVAQSTSSAESADRRVATVPANAPDVFVLSLADLENFIEYCRAKQARVHLELARLMEEREAIIRTMRQIRHAELMVQLNGDRDPFALQRLIDLVQSFLQASVSDPRENS
ncbi:hypothetical protein BJX76DRAFT_342415 [Aspergillus varians]